MYFLFQFQISTNTYRCTTQSYDITYNSEVYLANNGVLNLDSVEKNNLLESKSFSFEVHDEGIQQLALSTSILNKSVEVWVYHELINTTVKIFTGFLKGKQVKNGVITLECRTSFNLLDYTNDAGYIISKSQLSSGNGLFDGVESADATIALLNNELSSLQSQSTKIQKEIDDVKRKNVFTFYDSNWDKLTQIQNQIEIKKSKITDFESVKSSLEKSMGATLPLVYGDNIWIDGKLIDIKGAQRLFVFTKLDTEYYPTDNTIYAYIDNIKVTFTRYYRDSSGNLDGAYAYRGSSGGLYHFLEFDIKKISFVLTGGNQNTLTTKDNYVIALLSSFNILRDNPLTLDGSSSPSISSFKLEITNNENKTYKTLLKEYLTLNGITNLSNFADETGDANIVLDLSKTIKENIEIMCKDDLSKVGFENGNYTYSKLVQNQTSVLTLNEDNILSDVDYYFNEDDRIAYLTLSYSVHSPATGQYEDAYDDVKVQSLIDIGHTNKEELEISTIDPTKEFREQFANQWLDFYNNQIMLDFEIDLFSGWISSESRLLQINDVVTISYDRLSLVSETFFIENINFDFKNAKIKLKLLKYDNAYFDRRNNLTDSVIDVDESLFNIPDILNLTILENPKVINNAVVTNIDISWFHSYDYSLKYYITLDDGVNTSIYETTSKTYSINNLAKQTYNISVYAINEYGYRSNTVFGEITLVGFTTPPNVPTSITSTVVNNQVYLRWDLSTQEEVLNGGKYEIRYNPNSSVWSGAIPIAKVSGTTSEVTAIARDGYYILRTANIDGVMSSGAISTQLLNVNIVPLNLIDTNVFDFVNYYSISNLRVESNKIQFDLPQLNWDSLNTYGLTIDNLDSLGFVDTLGVQSTGNPIDGYIIFNVYDLGAILSNVRIYNQFDINSYQVNVTWDNLDSLGTVDGLDYLGFIDSLGAEIDVNFYIKTSTDNITWTEWTKFVVGDFNLRYYQFKMVFSSQNDYFQFDCDQFDTIADIPDIIETNEFTYNVNAGVTKTITYSSTFYAIPNKPMITVQNQAYSNEYFTISNFTPNSFDIVCYNTLNENRTINYIVKGY